MERDRLLNSIPNIISEEKNRVLYQKISKEELRVETFQLNLDKAPRPDGFSASSFKFLGYSGQ